MVSDFALRTKRNIRSDLLCKRTGNATATTSGRELDWAPQWLVIWNACVVPVRDIGTAASDTRGAAVEEWRVRGILMPPRPIVVRQVAFEPALVPQQLLVGVYKITMPCKKAGLAASIVYWNKTGSTHGSVDGVCLHNMSYHKIIVATSCPRCNGRWCER
jgi:hypothetical protein